MLVGTANDDDSVIIPGDYNSRRIVVITVDPPRPGYAVALYTREIYKELIGSALHIAMSRAQNPHSILSPEFRQVQAERNLPYSGQRIIAEDLTEWLNNGGRKLLPLSTRELHTHMYPEDNSPSNKILGDIKKTAIALGLEYHPNYNMGNGKRNRVIKENCDSEGQTN